MKTKDLEELAASFVASLTTTAEEALFYELFPTMLDLLARGKPVSVEEIAAASGKSPEEVQLAIDQVAGVDRDEQGRIVGAGLSLVPTPHRFELEGQTLFAWCALGTLMYPVFLGRPVSIESPCRGTGEPVRIKATPTEIGAVEPPSAVASIVVPKDLASVRSVVCANVHFFSSPEAVSRWLEKHPEATILPVEEAFRLGQLIAEGILDISRSDRSADAERERTEGETMTNSVNLEDVARAVAAGEPDLDADGQRIFVQTFRLLARGEPVSPAEIADAAGVPTEQAEERLRSWPLAFWDDQDRVVSFWGLAVGRLKTAHRIEANGLTVHGWCAWDTLFITEILGTETHVESADPLTGETIRLAVTPERVKEVRPEGAVVSFLRPDGPFGPDVVETFCYFVHFFASRESAERWMAEHPGTFLLSVDEAFELGRLTNRLRAPEVLGGGEVVR